jgi:hypothetical protein
MPTEGILDDFWAAGRTLYAWRVIEPGWINQLYVDPRHTGGGPSIPLA